MLLAFSRVYVYSEICVGLSVSLALISCSYHYEYSVDRDVDIIHLTYKFEIDQCNNIKDL